MTFAAELRAAATYEREEWGGAYNARMWPDASALHLALAEWLDDTADFVPPIRTADKALAVARAINGGAA